MDEGEYKATFREVNERPCPFTKALLSRCCACSRARKLLLAEREAIACLSPAAHSRCTTLHDLLREKALFALRLTQSDGGQLPHAKEMKVQCGGLLGLDEALHGGSGEAPLADVNALVEEALARHGEFAALPYGEIVKAVTAFQLRRRGARR